MPGNICLRVKSCSLRQKQLELYDCSTFSIEKDNLKSSLMTLFKSIFAHNCRLQKTHVNSDCAESFDGPLAIDSCSLRFSFASQI